MPARKKLPSSKRLTVGDIHARILRPARASDPDRPYWQAIAYAEGTQETVWTGRGTREEVLEELKKLDRTREQERAGDGTVVTLGDMLRRWVGGLKEELGEHDGTFIAYRTRARALEKTIGSCVLGRVSPATLQGHVATRAGAKIRSTTISNELVAFGVAWRWAYEMGLVVEERPPLNRQTKRRRRGRIRRMREAGQEIPTVASDKRPKYTPTVEEVGLVLDQLEGWHRVVVCILCSTGMRLGEIGNLLWRDLDFERRVIHIRDVAGNKTGERWTPMAEDLARELLRWRDSERKVRGKPVRVSAHPNDTVTGVSLSTIRGFSTRMLAEACDRAGVPRFTSHGFRRYVIDTYGDANVEASTVGDAVGNSSREIEKSYRRRQKVTAFAAAQEEVGPRIPTEADVLQFRSKRKTSKK